MPFRLPTDSLAHGMTSRADPRAAGFTLVELAVVLVIIGLLAVLLLPTSATVLDNQNRAQTAQKLKNIDAALNNFVVVHKRLPCPADGTALNGIEAPVGGGTSCNANQGNGVVPWATLGLTAADAVDAWSDQITYRVGYGLTAAGALDMTSCDPAGSANSTTGAWGGGAANLGLCAATCTGTFSAANCTSPQNFLVGKGLNVSNGTSLVMDYSNYTGAAYVLTSHGRNNYGALTATGTYQSTAVRAVAGNLEAANIVTTTVTSGVPPTFNDATFSDTANVATYFDDLQSHPAVIAVINNAQLGPRSH